MIDIIDRLRFDAARCEASFSKGVAGNIEEAAEEIEWLRTVLDEIVRRHDYQFLDRGIGTATPEGSLWLEARRCVVHGGKRDENTIATKSYQGETGSKT